MKKNSLLVYFIFLNLILFAQARVNIDLTLTYKGAPLCYWDVTIKNGDAALAKGKTDSKGNLQISSVQLVSLSINASGYKKTANGEKKWDVNGYMQLDENGKGNFDFEKVVAEAGMPVGLIEAAWGLTLADCASGGRTSSSSNTSSNGSSSSNDAWQAEQEKKKEEQNAKQQQFHEDWASGKTQAEGMQNTKEMQENKIASLDKKIEKKRNEITNLDSGSKEYDEASYELKEFELEKDLTQIKLERTNAQIAAGNTTLGKADRQSFNEREDAIKLQMDQLKEDKKNGVSYSNRNDIEEEFERIEKANANPSEERTRELENIREIEPVEEEKIETSKTETAEDLPEPVGEEGISIATPSEIADMSVLGLKKLKLEYNSKITSRKASITSKGAVMRPSKKEQLEKEIKQLEEGILLIDEEIKKRNG